MASRGRCARGTVLGALVVVALLATGCVGPARTDDAYGGKAASTLDEVHASVETAMVAAEAADRHGLPSAYLSTLLAEAEEDAEAADATLASIQPPSGSSDETRSRARRLSGEAVDELAAMRIEARRSDGDALAGHLDRLGSLASALDRLAADLRGPR